MIKYYKGYKIEYEVRDDIKDITIYDGKIYSKDSTNILSEVISSNETTLIKFFHNIVLDIINGKNIEKTYVQLTTEEYELFQNSKDKIRKKMTKPLDINIIVGDILAPRLSDIIDTSEAIIIIEKGDKYTGLAITENNDYEYIVELNHQDIINDYKVIGRIDPVVDIGSIIELRGLENRIKKIIDNCKNSIDNAINTFDKSEEEITDDLIEFIKNTKDIDETARLQYLKVLGVEY